jgi:hypothetical protein
MRKVIIHNHLGARDNKRTHDSQELDYYKLLRSRNGLELVEGQLTDKGKWGVYGPGGWSTYRSLSEATKYYRELLEDYGD